MRKFLIGYNTDKHCGENEQFIEVDETKFKNEWELLDYVNDKALELLVKTTDIYTAEIYENDVMGEPKIVNFKKEN